jgi:hypothetical protein
MPKRKPTPEEIKEANQAVSRPKSRKFKGGASQSSILPASAVLLQGEKPKSETESALRRAAKSNDRHSKQ